MSYMHRFLHVLKTCLKDKIFVSGGRGHRYEFFVFNIFAMLVRGVIYGLQGLVLTLGLTGFAAQGVSMVFVVLSFILFIAQYTSTLRRLHDTNRTGHHLLPIIIGVFSIFYGIFTANAMIMLVGEVITSVSVLYALILCALPGTKGPNRFGQPPI